MRVPPLTYRLGSLLPAVVAVVALLFFRVDGVLAQPSFIFTPSERVVLPNAQVCIPIVVTDFRDILKFSVKFNFDPRVVRFDSIKNSNLEDLNQFSYTLPGPLDRSFRIEWTAPGFLQKNGKSLPDGATLMELCFTAKGTPGDYSSVEITNLGRPNNNPDPFIQDERSAGRDVGLINNRALIAIQRLPVELRIGASSAKKDEITCVPVTVARGFDNVKTANIEVVYNANYLAFNGAINLKPVLGTFFLGKITEPKPGTILIKDSTLLAAGYTLAAGEKLFDLCFKMKFDCPKVDEFPNPFDPFKYINVRDSVSIVRKTSAQTRSFVTGGGGQIDRKRCTNDILIRGGVAYGSVGDIVALPHSLAGFQNLTRFDIDFDYNASRMRAVGVYVAPNAPPGFSAASVDLSQAATGKIRVRYSNPTPQSFPDGDALFYIRFELIGPVNTVNDVIPDLNTDNIVRAPLGKIELAVEGKPGLYKYGSVIILTSDPVKTYVGNAEAPKGSKVCIDIKVDGFQNITKYRQAFSWDASVIKLVEIKPIGLPRNGTPACAKGFEIRDSVIAGRGYFGIDWYAFTFGDPKLCSSSFPDGHVVATLCFEIVGDSTSCTTIAPAEFPYPSKPNFFNFSTFVGTAAVPIPVGIDLREGFVCSAYKNAFTLNLPSNAQIGLDTSCFSVSVNDYHRIDDWRLTLGFDTSLFKFVTVKPTNRLRKLAVDRTDAANGRLGFSIKHLSPTSLTSGTNPTNAFDLCFVTKPGPTACARIDSVLRPVKPYAFANRKERNIMVKAGSMCRTSPYAPIGVAVVNTSVSCDGRSDGALALAPSGGAGTYVYDWTGPGTVATAKNQSGLAPGSYSVKVTDPSGWSTPYTRTFVIGSKGPAPVANAGADLSAPCDSTDPVALDGSGSLAPPGSTYSWRAISGTAAVVSGGTTLSATLSGEGQAELTITSLGGCTSTDIVEVTRVSSIAVEVAERGNLSCDIDEVVLRGAVTPATATVSYRWTTANGVLPTGALNAASITVGAGGTYTLTVTDVGTGCVTKRDFPVAVNRPSIVATIQKPDTLSCKLSTVTLESRVTTTATNLSYAWTSADGNVVGAIDQPIAVADRAGTYRLRVRDQISGCIDTRTVFVDSSYVVPAAVASADVALTCQVPQQTLSVASLGPRRYQYAWMGPAGGIVSGATLRAVTVGKSGTYVVEVTDAVNGCSATDDVVVREDKVLPTASAGADRVLSCDTTEVRLRGTAASESGSFLVKWTTKGGKVLGSGDSLSVVAQQSGKYYFTVTDGVSGCTSVDSLEVTQSKDAPQATAGPDQQLNCKTDRVTLAGSGSTGEGFGVSWTTTDGALPIGTETTFRPTVFEAGTYTITVTNLVSGCSASSSAVVTLDTARPSFTLPETIVGNCEREPVRVTLGGTVLADSLRYAYAWRDASDAVVATGPTVTLPAAGTYTVLVRDLSTGCERQRETTVSFPAKPTTEFSVDTSTFICGGDMIALRISAATLAANQVISWELSNGDTNSALPTPTADPAVYAASTKGDYRLVLTAPDGSCVTKSAPTTLFDARTRLGVDAGVDLQQTCRDTVVTAGPPPLASEDWRVLWTGPAAAPIDNPTSLQATFRRPGTYTLTVTDPQTKCTGQDQLIVLPTGSEELSVTLPEDFTLGCGESRELKGTFTAGTGPAILRWWEREAVPATLSTTDALEVSVPGVYYFSVTDEATGCVATDSIAVDQVRRFVVGNVPAYSMNCVDTVVATSIAVSNPGGLNLSYEWRAGDSGEVVGPTDGTRARLRAGVYTFTAKDTEGSCEESRTVVVSAYDGPRVEATADITFDGCTKELVLVGNESDSTRGTWRLLRGTLEGFDPRQPQQTLFDPAIGSYRLMYQIKPEVCRASEPVTVDFEIQEDARVEVYDRVEEASAKTRDTTLQAVPSTEDNLVTRVVSADSALVTVNGANRFSIRDWAAQTLTIKYEVCDRNCLTRCDTALLVIVRKPAPPVVELPDRGFPNTITPNGDGLNEVFIIEPLYENPGLYPRARLTIVNRWGTILFNAQPYNNDFGGVSDQGKEIPNGTYYYIFTLDPLEGEVYKGPLTIIR